VTHEVKRPKEACGQCLANQKRYKAETGKDQRLPCGEKPCPFNASHLMLPDLYPWIEFFYATQSEFIHGGGLLPFVMQDAGALRGDLIGLFLQMRGAFRKAKEEMR